jgi:transposase
MYIKHCKLSTKKQLRLIEYFVAGTPARTAADLVGVHRNSAIRFFHKLREKIALKQQDRSEQFCGKIELDESYFCGIRKGKRGRGAPGKVPVFGILKVSVRPNAYTAKEFGAVKFLFGAERG